MADHDDPVLCEEQFAALVSRHSQLLYRIAYAVLRNSHDAEDAVQEVFLKLYRSSQWRKMRDERAYLARMTWRTAVDRLPEEADAAFHQFASPVETPEQLAAEANWNAVVHRLVDSLPESLRLPLLLSHSHDLKSSEVARVLDIPEGTVRRRVMEARAILKQKLTAVTGVPHAR